MRAGSCRSSKKNRVRIRVRIGSPSDDTRSHHGPAPPLFSYTASRLPYHRIPYCSRSLLYTQYIPLLGPISSKMYQKNMGFSGRE